MLFISTVSYSVRVYGPDTEAENINSVAVRIIGKDDVSTELKYLTDKATEGYEMYLKHLESHQQCSASRKKKNLLRVVFSTLFSVLDIPIKHRLLRLIYYIIYSAQLAVPRSGGGARLQGLPSYLFMDKFRDLV